MPATVLRTIDRGGCRFNLATLVHTSETLTLTTTPNRMLGVAPAVVDDQQSTIDARITSLVTITRRRSALEKLGGRSRARTCDPLIKSYRLDYPACS